MPPSRSYEIKILNKPRCQNVCIQRVRFLRRSVTSLENHSAKRYNKEDASKRACGSSSYTRAKEFQIKVSMAFLKLLIFMRTMGLNLPVNRLKLTTPK